MDDGVPSRLYRVFHQPVRRSSAPWLQLSRVSRGWTWPWVPDKLLPAARATSIDWRFTNLLRPPHPLSEPGNLTITSTAVHQGLTHRGHHSPVPNILITALRSPELLDAAFLVVAGVAILRLVRRRHAGSVIAFGSDIVWWDQRVSKEEHRLNESANRSASKESAGPCSVRNREQFGVQQHGTEICAPLNNSDEGSINHGNQRSHR